MDKDRKIFHEPFYQEAQKKFTEAYNTAEQKLEQGIYDRTVIQKDLNQVEHEIQEAFATGFHEFAEKTKAAMNQTVKDYTDQIEKKQQENGTAELLRRQNLEAKLENFNADDLHEFIGEQLTQESVSDFDVSAIKKVCGSFDSPELKTDLNLLSHKLPREAAKNSDKYQALEHDLHQASFTDQRSIFLDNEKGGYEGTSISGAFRDLMASQGNY